MMCKLVMCLEPWSCVLQADDVLAVLKSFVCFLYETLSVLSIAQNSFYTGGCLH